jgi:hypothetical protein
MYHLFTWKKWPKKIWAASVIFKELAKLCNHPRGENSPNPVTLTGSRSTFQTNDRLALYF